MSKDIDPEELVTNADNLRALIREAHAANKDLQKAMQKFEQMKSVVTRQIQETADAVVGAVMEAAVNDQIKQIGPYLKSVMDASVQVIGDQFDALFNSYMRGVEDGGPETDLRALVGNVDPEELKGYNQLIKEHGLAALEQPSFRVSQVHLPGCGCDDHNGSEKN